MGAEPWSCFVPYQSDIQAALDAAQAQEFVAGLYRIDDPESPPATIEEAREQAEADGTCSVLDMLGVVDTPHEVVNGHVMGGLDNYRNLCMVAPLSDDQLIRLYGTGKPTRTMVLIDTELYQSLDRGIGSYVIIYEGETPTEIYFAGLSFD
jgi:hypothetical protein